MSALSSARRDDRMLAAPRRNDRKRRLGRRLLVQALAPLALVPAVGVVGAATAALALAALLRRRRHTPLVTGQSTQFNSAVLALCPSLTAPYSLPAVLGNRHVETIFAALFRRRLHLLYDRELVHTPDGGCVALDTEDLPPEKQLPDDAPVLILLPGLTGGSEDSYVQQAVVHARETGIRAVVFNSRGTSGSPVLTAQFYSASHTDDLRQVVAHVQHRYPRCSHLFAAGWSVGANILTRYLGEEGEGSPLSAAVALCNPFDLLLSRASLRTGFSKLYSRNLARMLKRILSQHRHLFEAEAAAGGRPYRPDLALAAKTIGQYDDAITRVSFCWPDVMTYYERSGSAESIPHVRVPLLILQAANDPISPWQAIPTDAIAANPRCLLVLTPNGGHLGWCGGSAGVTGAPWSDAGIAEFFTAVRQLLAQPEFAADAAAAGTAAAAAQRQRQGRGEEEAPADPEGVYVLGETTHQAP